MMNFPEDFKEAIQSLLGVEQQTELLKALEEKPSISIRHNPFKSFKSLPHETQLPWANTGRYLLERPSFTLDPSFHAGAYYVQEASSMFLEQALTQLNDLSKPLKVLDLCAAPGGKSTHILSLINKDSLLVSNEVIKSRAGILASNITKWGWANAIVTSNDPKDFSELKGFFDVVIVDAPCSGEGLFRKDTEARQEWSPKNVELCSLRQQRILQDVIPALAENGVLIYSTCTFNTKENEENVRSLLSTNEFISEKISIYKSWGVEEVNDRNLFAYRFYPHKVNGEGFFLSAFRKVSSSQSIKTHAKEKYKPIKDLAEYKNWIVHPESFEFYERNGIVYIIPISCLQDFNFLKEHLHIIQAGTALGTIKHGKFIPEHALAFSNNLKKEALQTHELNEMEALQFLRMESLMWSGLPLGHTLVTYQGNGLGWINVLSNRINNLLPNSWRIRNL